MIAMEYRAGSLGSVQGRGVVHVYHTEDCGHRYGLEWHRDCFGMLWPVAELDRQDTGCKGGYTLMDSQDSGREHEGELAWRPCSASGEAP